MGEFIDLLLNMMFIIVPVLVCYVFAKDFSVLSNNSKEVLLGFLAAASMILCMTFSLHPYSNFNFDLRAVPLMIGILYGGPRVTIFLSAALLIYRTYLGGDGLYTTLVVYSILVPLTYFLIPAFQQADRLTKILLTMSYSLFAPIFFCLIIFLYQGVLYGLSTEADIGLFLLDYILAHTVTMGVAVYWLERMRDVGVLQNKQWVIPD
jgi:two-component system, sporulation sensor kinase B